MMRELPKQIVEWSLVVALVLFLYGREQRHAGRDTERERVLVLQIAATTAHADSLAIRYTSAVQRGDSLGRLTKTLTARRQRSVAALNTVVARADTVATRADHGDQIPYAEFTALLSAVKVDRLASDSLIASLESSVVGLRTAITVADSLLTAQDAVIRVQEESLALLERQAHPPLVSRLLAAGKWVAVGAVGALVWMALPR